MIKYVEIQNLFFIMSSTNVIQGLWKTYILFIIFFSESYYTFIISGWYDAEYIYPIKLLKQQSSYENSDHPIVSYKTVETAYFLCLSFLLYYDMRNCWHQIKLDVYAKWIPVIFIILHTHQFHSSQLLYQLYMKSELIFNLTRNTNCVICYYILN